MGELVQHRLSESDLTMQVAATRVQIPPLALLGAVAVLATAIVTVAPAVGLALAFGAWLAIAVSGSP